MSEIKGQILGVVLVLAIFGAIGTVLVTAFKNNATSIANKIGSTTDGETDPDSSFIDKNKTNNSRDKYNTKLENFELLKF